MKPRKMQQGGILVSWDLLVFGCDDTCQHFEGGTEKGNREIGIGSLGRREPHIKNPRRGFGSFFVGELLSIWNLYYFVIFV